MLPMLEDYHEFDFSKAMYVPIGMASPLWLPFAAATGAGLAFWWMTRWTSPANLEALMDAVAPPAVPSLLDSPEAPMAEPLLEAAETLMAQTEEVAEAAAETMEVVANETQDAVEAATQAAVEGAEAIVPTPKKKPKPAPEAPLH